jgi:hypothetical protein
MTLKLTLVGCYSTSGRTRVANSTGRGRGSCDTVRWLGIPTLLLCLDLEKSSTWGAS